MNIHVYFSILILLLSSGCSDRSIDNVQSLGAEKFTVSSWKNANQEHRGQMVYSFIKQHDLKSMTVMDIKELLGESTAYYEYDEIPAYIVGPPSIQSQLGNGYVLAFPFNRETELISGFVLIPDIDE